MRYLVLSILTLSLHALNAGQGVSKPAEPVKTPVKEQPAQRKMVMPDQVDQHDTTDIFAIPFDTSETEEDIEIENLDKLSAKLQAKKAEQAKLKAAQQALKSQN
jgi:hypothetical protein